MRRDDLYLADIVSATDAIAEFVADVGEAQFVSDDLVRSAVLHKLTIIGEAAARISPTLHDKHPHVPWRDIIAFRNLVVHRYFGIDWHIVWNTVVRDVPLLRAQIAELIEQHGRQHNA